MLQKCGRISMRREGSRRNRRACLFMRLKNANLGCAFLYLSKLQPRAMWIGWNESVDVLKNGMGGCLIVVAGVEFQRLTISTCAVAEMLREAKGCAIMIWADSKKQANFKFWITRFSLALLKEKRFAFAPIAQVRVERFEHADFSWQFHCWFKARRGRQVLGDLSSGFHTV